MTGRVLRIGPSVGRRAVWIGLGVLAALVLPAIGVLAGVALASSAFDDVDPDGTHAEGIEWLAESGVTAGCEVGRFCPSDAVTREQMGTFLFRLSGNNPAVAPSVNAATLQGLTVAELLEAFEAGELPPGIDPVPPGEDPTAPDAPEAPDDDPDGDTPDGDTPDGDTPGGDTPDGGDPDGGAPAPDDPTTPPSGDLGVLDQRLAELESTVLFHDQRLAAIDGLLQLDLDADPDDALVAAVISLSVALSEQAEVIEQLETDVTAREATISSLETEVGRLTALLAGVSRQDDTSGRDTLRFSGMNVQVVNGRASTNVTPNGLGNLIIGHDRARTPADAAGLSQKSGSHYLVVGDGNNYVSYGGIIAGQLNLASGPFATITGGSRNTANRPAAAVAGGSNNTASGIDAAVAGGFNNTASGLQATVSGGGLNTASGEQSAVSGGQNNTAEGDVSSVSGGTDNRASAIGRGSSILGGNQEVANTDLQRIPS